MIDAVTALKIARKQADGLRHSEDSLFTLWEQAICGAPVLVHDVYGRPSYWLVPVVKESYVVGFVRLTDAGDVMDLGSFCRDPRNIHTCPEHVTGISMENVRQKMNAVTLEPGEVAGMPLFVHDGPVGRETWRVETVLNGAAHRWFFISSGGIYERPAGSILDESSE